MQLKSKKSLKKQFHSGDFCRFSNLSNCTAVCGDGHPAAAK